MSMNELVSNARHLKIIRGGKPRLNSSGVWQGKYGQSVPTAAMKKNMNNFLDLYIAYDLHKATKFN